jgi:hypothetical protein
MPIDFQRGQLLHSLADLLVLTKFCKSTTLRAIANSRAFAATQKARWKNFGVKLQSFPIENYAFFFNSSMTAGSIS